MELHEAILIVQIHLEAPNGFLSMESDEGTEPWSEIKLVLGWKMRSFRKCLKPKSTVFFLPWIRKCIYVYDFLAGDFSIEVMEVGEFDSKLNYRQKEEVMVKLQNNLHVI